MYTTSNYLHQSNDLSYECLTLSFFFFLSYNASEGGGDLQESREACVCLGGSKMCCSCLFVCISVLPTNGPHCVFISGDRNRHPGHSAESPATVCAALRLPAATQQTLLRHPQQAAQAGPH